MIKELGLQLFTIRNQMKDEDSIRASFKKLREMGYDIGQTAGFFVGAEKFAEIAKETGLKICGTHCSFNELIADPDKAMREHELLGTTNIGIGGMPGEARESLDALKTFIDNANEFAAYIAKSGFKFTYHNHSFEFRKFEGKTMLDYLAEGFDKDNISFVLDTYWVQHGGGDVRAWMEKLAGRIGMLHPTGVGVAGTQDITESGQGRTNFGGISETADKIGVKYYVVEQDSCPGDPFDSLKISRDYIKARYMA